MTVIAGKTESMEAPNWPMPSLTESPECLGMLEGRQGCHGALGSHLSDLQMLHSLPLSPSCLCSSHLDRRILLHSACPNPVCFPTPTLWHRLPCTPVSFWHQLL